MAAWLPTDTLRSPTVPVTITVGERVVPALVVEPSATVDIASLRYGA
jgi:hypothetical protein